jgi:ABC-type multidrug transport system fused ATPase/permease subunit
MVSLLKDVYRHLSPKRRVQLLLVQLLMLAGALAEVVTLGAVLPFLALLADPTLASAGPLVQQVLNGVGGALGVGPLLAAALLFGSMAFVSAAIRLTLTWASYKFVFMVGADLGRDIYSRILQQPYTYHLQHNSSETLAAMQKVNMLVMGTLSAAMQMAIACLMSTFIFAGLLWINAPVALTAVGLFAGLYWLSSRYAKHKLTINSEIIAVADVQKNKAMQEGLGAIRDVILDDNHPVYVAQFAKADLAQRHAQATNMVLAGAPKYVIESLGLVLIVGLAYFLASGPQGAAAALPVLGALALGAQRMLPHMQNIYNSLSTIRGNQAGAQGALDLLALQVPERVVQQATLVGVPNFNAQGHRIELRNVHFQYGPHTPWVLKGLNLQVDAGHRIGFIGTTGSGKSTLIDLIMGLLHPTKGQLLVDGEPLNAVRMKAWQARIAHVPQAIYLSDTTIAENIALGIPRDQIDMGRLKAAINEAQLADVLKQLPQGLETRVGERGVQLSGGQRQRIGIARALYKQADVLVLDEATSALDTETEVRVMDAIYRLHPDMVVLMIAHRTSTLKGCQSILEVKGGIICHQP